MPPVVLLIVCFLLYEPLTTSSTPESNTTYLTLNCSGKPLDLDVRCNRTKLGIAGGINIQYQFPANFNISVECYEEIQSVKLVSGSSPLEGLVFREADEYICYDGFDVRAADSVCRELGFPAVKDYSAQTLSSAETSNGIQWLSYSTGCQSARVKDCLWKLAWCFWNKAVRLRCREPGFLGCYLDNRHTFQTLYTSGSIVNSEEECVSTCRGKIGHHDIAIVNDRNCVCYRSEEYANFISSRSFTHYWTLQTKKETGQQAHCLFNLSVGFCEHPGPVSDGYWDSNITIFGSEITLTCGEGFVINGSATLQCAGLPGWSTFFPVWNASVPSCRAVENATNDERHDLQISTSSQITVSTSSKWQSTEEQTTLHKRVKTTSSVSGHLNIDMTIGLYTLGSFLISLAIFSVAWCKHHERRHRPSQASNQLLQMYPVGTSNHSPSSADHVVLNASGSHGETTNYPLPHHPGNSFREVTAHKEDSYHIYHDNAEAQKGVSQPSRVEEISPCPFSSQNINTSVSPSLDQTEKVYEECSYQDVDLDRNTCFKERAYKFPGGVRLFDDTCYNSLNFAKRSDGVCTYRQDCRISSLSNAKGELENEYGESCQFGSFEMSRSILKDNDEVHIKHASLGGGAHVHHPAHPSICPTLNLDLHSNRKGNISCSNIHVGSPTAAPSEDVYNFQLDPIVPKDNETINISYHPDVFDLSEYNLPIPIESSIDSPLHYVRKFGKDSERHDPESPIRKELYVRVNETVRTASQGLSDTQVDITKAESNVDAKATLPEELYLRMNETKAQSLTAEPMMCEGIYINVVQTLDSCNADRKPALQEGIYMNVTDI
ncbi:LOW QUALITY PROTEIN: uncharacterized protein [Diadema setosum]|uniref:LOW QUALITY PROTEIN: uncharacterized protein n=1 Tax=Diadema setosum TaxID=31175 RepID=UPI003B3A1027